MTKLADVLDVCNQPAGYVNMLLDTNNHHQITQQKSNHSGSQYGFAF